MAITSNPVPFISGANEEDVILSIRTAMAQLRQVSVDQITPEAYLGPNVIDLVCGATTGMGVSITGNAADFAHMTVRDFAKYIISLPRVQP